MTSLGRWLATEGEIGQPPEWWSLIQASRYLGVPPWELARRPVWWMRIALAAQDAEAREQNRRNDKKGG
jgi:hypothetical protein